MSGRARRTLKRAAKRRDAKREAAFYNPLPPLPGNPRTAAQDVYQIGELRRRILSFCEAKHLTSFIRAEKGCMGDVAGVMYYSMERDKVEGALSESTERDQLYRACITEITVFRPVQTLASYLGQLDTLIPSLRIRFRNARRVIFGCHRTAQGQDSLVVHLEPHAIISAAHTADYIFTHTVSLSTELPPAFIRPIAAPPGWTLRYRFDLVIGEAVGAKSAAGLAWLKNLRDNASLGNIHHLASLGQLEVSIEDLAGLYDKQAALGYRRNDRIVTIHANHATQFTLPRFKSSAAVARASLTYLSLAAGYRGEQAGLGIDDLHPFLALVRESLPNLATLQLSVTGIEHTETASRQSLHPDILSESGGIGRLTIFCAPDSGPLFDTLRSLAPALRQLDPVIDIAHSDITVWGSQAQSTCLDNLRKTPVHQRKHLSTIPFADLDIVNPRSVTGLAFDMDGRPLRRGHSKAIKWADRAVMIQQQVQFDLGPAVSRGYYSTAAFKRLAPTADAEAILETSLNLLEGFRDARKQARAVESALRGREKAVQRFIDSLVAGAELRLGVPVAKCAR